MPPTSNNNNNNNNNVISRSRRHPSNGEVFCLGGRLARRCAAKDHSACFANILAVVLAVIMTISGGVVLALTVFYVPSFLDREIDRFEREGVLITGTITELLPDEELSQPSLDVHQDESTNHQVATNEDSRRVYSYCYTYTVDDATYTNTGYWKNDDRIEVGQALQLKILPTDPRLSLPLEDCANYERLNMRFPEKAVMFAMGLLYTALISFSMYIFSGGMASLLEIDAKIRYVDCLAFASFLGVIASMVLLVMVVFDLGTLGTERGYKIK